jgi:hypothetical protein
MFFTEHTKIGYIWASPKGREILLKHAPELMDSPYIFFTKMKSLSDYVTANQSINRSEDWLRAVMNELSTVEYEVDKNTEILPLPNYESDRIPVGSSKIVAAESVGKWDVFEIELHGPSHGNPFVDVAISAQFSCDGYSADINGFYDGEGTYKIRFMPEKEGQWSYRTTSNARSLNGIEGQFTCGPANGTNRGQVRVADTFHFTYSDGTRYLPVGTTCYAWTHQPIELEEQTLATLSEGPFNKMRMCIFPKAYLYNENEPIHYPFQGSLEEGWDYTRFNPTFFQHLDQRIAELNKLGIEADLILFHAYDRWGFSEMGKSADDLYLKYITARLSAFSNVWWSLANEYDLMWSKEEDDWERFASIVTNHDPYNHLISVHNCFKIHTTILSPFITALNSMIIQNLGLHIAVYKGLTSIEHQKIQMSGEKNGVSQLLLMNVVMKGTSIWAGETFLVRKWFGDFGKVQSEVDTLAMVKPICIQKIFFGGQKAANFTVQALLE